MWMNFAAALRSLLPASKGFTVRTRLKWLIHYSY